MSNPVNTADFELATSPFLLVQNQFSEAVSTMIQQKFNKEQADASALPIFPSTESRSRVLAQWGNFIDDVALSTQLKFNEGALNLTEKAAQTNPAAANGAVWLRSDTPNTLMFTDDAGTDHVLGGLIAAETLQATLVAGNTTGGTGIIVSSGDPLDMRGPSPVFTMGDGTDGLGPQFVLNKHATDNTDIDFENGGILNWRHGHVASGNLRLDRHNTTTGVLENSGSLVFNVNGNVTIGESGQEISIPAAIIPDAVIRFDNVEGRIRGLASAARSGGLLNLNRGSSDGNAGVVAGAALSGNTAGGAADLTAGVGFGTGVGGAAVAAAGDGGATGNGGNARLIAGDGGATSGNAGQVSIQGGDAQINGGDIDLVPGNGAGVGFGGSLNLAPGEGTGSGIHGAVAINGTQTITEVITDTLVASENDYAPTGWPMCNVLELTAAGGGSTLSGIDADECPDGMLLMIVNVGTTDTILLPHASVSSDPENGFFNGDNATIPVRRNGAVWVRRDGTPGAGRWRTVLP
jgi:hypothetical protein